MLNGGVLNHREPRTCNGSVMDYQLKHIRNYAILHVPLILINILQEVGPSFVVLV